VTDRIELAGTAELPFSPRLLIEVVDPYDETTQGYSQLFDKISSALQSGTKVCLFKLGI
jgi:hypothetical protein